MRKLENETGRTFKELLGISIFALIFAGLIIIFYYTMIHRNQSSELVKKSIERAIVVVGQIQSGQEPTLTEFENDDTVHGGRFLPLVQLEETQFKIILMNVEAKICQEMKRIIGTQSPLRRIEGECGTTLYLVFNKDFTTKDVKKEEEDTSCRDIICPEYAPCEKGICQCPQYEGQNSAYRVDVNLCCYEEYAYDSENDMWQENVDCL